jgi:hypothetical protein
MQIFHYFYNVFNRQHHSLAIDEIHSGGTPLEATPCRFDRPGTTLPKRYPAADSHLNNGISADF